MRFEVRIQRTADDAVLAVKIVGPDDGEVIERTLTACPYGDDVVATLTAAECAALADDDLRGLANDDGAATASKILAARGAAYDTDPEPGAIRQFGRFLFEVLLGKAGWDAVTAAVVAEGTNNGSDPSTIPIELAVCIDASLPLLDAVPWELIHDGTEYLLLSVKRAVSLVRVTTPVDAATVDHSALTLDVPLRVLFCVGAGLHDRAVKPGAEYLGLLRRLEHDDDDAGRVVHPRLLLQATPARVAEAIETFRPQVVHFIGHGGAQDGRPYLRLTSPDDATKSVEQYAEQITALLRPKPDVDFPRVVVLGACESAAGADVGRERDLLARDLVAAGVPVVVGMSGRVADHACRLFTREFYAALVEGRPFVEATATARRAAFVGLSENAIVDCEWSRPVVFTAPSVPMKFTVRDDVDRKHQFDVASRYRTVRNPSVFCDRIGVREVFQDMMANWANGPGRGLAVEAVPPEEGGKVGQSRLLEELAARAAEEGFVPVVVSVPKHDDAPRNLTELLRRTMEALDVTRERFGENTARYQLGTLCEHIEDPLVDIEFEESVARYVENYPIEADAMPRPNVVRQALRVDLCRLAKDVGSGAPIVFFDNVQRLIPDVVDIVLGMWGDEGLGTRAEPIGVVVSWSTSGNGIKTQLELLKRFKERKPRGVHHVRLERFAAHEDELAYSECLLHHATPAVFAPDQRGAKALERMRQHFKGIPSRLAEAARLDLFVEMGLDGDLLRCADDEERLRRLREDVS